MEKILSNSEINRFRMQGLISRDEVAIMLDDGRIIAENVQTHMRRPMKVAGVSSENLVERQLLKD